MDMSIPFHQLCPVFLCKHDKHHIPVYILSYYYSHITKSKKNNGEIHFNIVSSFAYLKICNMNVSDIVFIKRENPQERDLI